MSNALTYAAKTYRTNFKNSLIFAFDGRQKRFINKVCEQQGWDKTTAYFIRCHVNGWDCSTKLTDPLQLQFVQDQRDHLENPINLDRKWLAQNMSNVLYYYNYMLTYLQQFNDVKTFTLAPISKIKSHFITIDTKILKHLMKNVNITSPAQECKLSEDVENKYKKKIWGQAFDYNAFYEPKKAGKEEIKDESIEQVKDKSKHEFNFMVQTDGVSACYHFLRPKKPGTPKSGNNTIPPINDQQRVIGIDPGRTNLMYGVEHLNNGQLKTYQLTRNAYYNQSGMTKANKQTHYWETQIKAAEDIFKQVSPKTTDGHIYDQYIRNYLSVYSELWQEKTKRKWGQRRFRTHRLKQKTLDRFFSKMKGKRKPDPIIAYGAAKFNPNGKNELSAPTTSLSKKCAQRYKTYMIDEYNTTKVCHKCDQPLHPVGEEINGKRSVYQQIRGLRWCSSTKCHNFLNRDKNAAINMIRKLREGEENVSLSRKGERSNIKPNWYWIKSTRRGEGIAAIGSG